METLEPLIEIALQLQGIDKRDLSTAEWAICGILKKEKIVYEVTNEHGETFFKPYPYKISLTNGKPYLLEELKK